MKQCILPYGLYLLAIALTCTNCTKPAIEDNTAPVALAGKDSSFRLPVNNIILKGNYTDAESTIDEFRWTKISGPDCTIQMSDQPSAQVQNMVAGEYLFEFFVADNWGLIGRDTVRVTVDPIPANAVMVDIQNNAWDCFWGCYLSVNNLSISVPAGRQFRLYIQRDNTTDWMEVINGLLANSLTLYAYYVDNNVLSVAQLYGGDAIDTPDLKIVY